MLDSLESLFPLCKILPVKAFKEKESFGDADILIEGKFLPSDWQEQIISMFSLKPEMWFKEKNSNVFSFAYRQLQVDLIVTAPDEFHTSYNYFNYNDLGNLLGRVAHAMGLKLGHDGLSYNWRVETYQFRNIILLTDWKDILPVLGYDYSQYGKGFDTLEDIFKFVVSSPSFSKDIYLLHNRNHTSRVRDAKRKTYMDFLKWLEGYEETQAQRSLAWWHNGCRKETGDKRSWLPHLFHSIKGFEAIYNSVQAEWEQAIEFKKRFNGELVKEWTGLSGKELGEFMRYMKEFLTDEKLRRDIMHKETLEYVIRLLGDEELVGDTDANVGWQYAYSRETLIRHFMKLLNECED